MGHQRFMGMIENLHSDFLSKLIVITSKVLPQQNSGQTFGRQLHRKGQSNKPDTKRRRNNSVQK